MDFLKYRLQSYALLIFFVSFFSINGFGFNPVYIVMFALIVVSLSFFVLYGSIDKICGITYVFVFMFSISQFIGIYFSVGDGNIEKNYESFIIFCMSALYTVCIYNCFNGINYNDRCAIYKLGGYVLCIFMLIELLSRLAIGNPSLGLLYGFKRSVLYFDSNFCGLVIMSFVMFFLYLRNRGIQGLNLILFTLCILLLTTMSRAAISAVVAGFFIFSSNKNYKIKSLIVMLFIILIFVFLSFLYIYNDFDFLDFDGSFNSKFYIVSKAVDLFDDNNNFTTMFGIGLGNFERYTEIFAHNIFVTIAIEMGVVGGILFLLYIYCSCIYSRGAALYIWVPVFICGVSLFGVYSPYIFMINGLIIFEELNSSKELELC